MSGSIRIQTFITTRIPHILGGNKSWEQLATSTTTNMPADRKHEAGPSKPRKYALPPIVGAGDEADIHGRPKPEREGEEDVDMDDEEEAAPTTGLTLKRKSKSKSKSPGVVYISRLPPGMTPHKVRHLMAKWGDVGRVYAQARDGELQ